MAVANSASMVRDLNHNSGYDDDDTEDENNNMILTARRADYNNL